VEYEQTHATMVAAACRILACTLSQGDGGLGAIWKFAASVICDVRHLADFLFHNKTAKAPFRLNRIRLHVDRERTRWKASRQYTQHHGFEDTPRAPGDDLDAPVLLHARMAWRRKRGYCPWMAGSGLPSRWGLRERGRHGVLAATNIGRVHAQLFAPGLGQWLGLLLAGPDVSVGLQHGLLGDGRRHVRLFHAVPVDVGRDGDWVLSKVGIILFTAMTCYQIVDAPSMGASWGMNACYLGIRAK
jgi:hypothetical protein